MNDKEPIDEPMQVFFPLRQGFAKGSNSSPGFEISHKWTRNQLISSETILVQLSGDGKLKAMEYGAMCLGDQPETLYLYPQSIW